jgi:gliding motility-associated-like protein
MRKLLLLLLLSCSSLQGYQAAAQNCSIPFMPVGTATSLGNCYQLTQQGNDFRVAAAWANRTIDLTQNFDFTFTVNQCGGADALVFVLQYTGPAASTGIGGVGGNLGYYRNQASAFAHSVAVELDIYQNVGPPFYDPADSHMMLALNGDPAGVLGPVLVPELNNCADHRLRISWTAATHLLTVQLDGRTRLSFTRDLVESVFGGNPTVWFGFTGSTGGQTATQTFCPVALSASPRVIPVEANGSASICPGRGVQLSVSGQPTGTTFQWSPAAGLSSTTGLSVTASPATTTTYTVIGRAPGGCELVGHSTVTVLGPPNVAVAVPRFLPTGSVRLTASSDSDGATYQWSPTTGLSMAEGSTVTLAAPLVATTYTVTATSPKGCIGRATIEVPPFLLPNIITPNGDGRNDTFRPLVTLDPVRLQVFSRWGQPVFEQADYDSTWSAAQLAAGSYYYRLSTENGESWKGWLEVVR